MEKKIYSALIDGSWWSSVFANTRGYGHYSLLVNGGRITIIDPYGLSVPPSVTKKIIEAMASTMELSSDEDVLASNLNILERSSTAQRESISKNTGGYIYAVRVGNKLKIGRTKNLDNRFKSYKKVSDRFSVIATVEVEDYFSAERDALKHFGGSPAKQEWFDYNSSRHIEVLEYFSKHLGAQVQL